MRRSVLVLGAGFGGLELSTMLSEASGGEIEVTLIDKGDAFVFGFSKLNVMFGREAPAAVRMPNAPSAEQMAKKDRFGSTRRARWFG